MEQFARIPTFCTRISNHCLKLIAGLIEDSIQYDLFIIFKKQNSTRLVNNCLINEETIDLKQLANIEIEEPEPLIDESDDGRLSTIEEGECEDEEENLDELFAVPYFEPMTEIDEV